MAVKRNMFNISHDMDFLAFSFFCDVGEKIFNRIIDHAGYSDYCALSPRA